MNNSQLLVHRVSERAL